jgi:hypothetical protein
MTPGRGPYAVREKLPEIDPPWPFTTDDLYAAMDFLSAAQPQPDYFRERYQYGMISMDTTEQWLQGL